MRLIFSGYRLLKSGLYGIIIIIPIFLTFHAQVAIASKIEVGPGKPYAAISDVPWESLNAGDIVLIHWRSTPYSEKWSISAIGTAASPVIVRGVPGPNGELPIVDGNNAVTRTQLNFWNENRGVVRVGGASIPAIDTPCYIVIENLEILGACPPNKFFGADGLIEEYAPNAAAIYIENGEHVVVRNCVLHSSANGLFSSSQIVDLLIEGNHLYENGMVGDAYKQNIYTQGRGVLIQMNYLGPLIAGALGNNLKDRSAGLEVRYNWIEGGHRQLDLVDSDDEGVNTDPQYGLTYVYGNILIDPDGAGDRRIVHYGGDSGNEPAYRKGTLHFYNNTVISQQQIGMILFRLSTANETVDARNNIFYLSTDGYLYVLNQYGTVNLNRNWLKEGWGQVFEASEGVVNGGATSVVGSSPGFVNAATQDFELSTDSPCIDAGGPLATVIYPNHIPAFEYVPHLSWRPRAVDSILDIGAYEHPEYAGDFDRDGDVDGSDLADLILGNETMDIAAFAIDFGRGNSPG
jgi:hypothetical protein